MVDEKTRARFWAKVRKADGDACWEWTASIFSHAGYGCFSLGRKLTGAHRASWVIHRGVIPVGLHVLHKCDNRLCVRPDHLFLGTPLDNARDMVEKGRGRPPTGDGHWMRRAEAPQRGARNFNAKLDEAAVKQVKVALAQGETSGVVARRFSVTATTICQIATGKNWPHVPWPDGASFCVDGDHARRSRGQHRRLMARTGGKCVEPGCGRRVVARQRCESCWVARRRKSKTDRARVVREQQRAARQ